METFKILIAEDEPTLLELMTELLEGEGFTCTPVANGREAMDFLSKNKIDLLITDFKMPLVDGPTLLEWCRNRKLHFPVIFITANVELLPQEEIALKDCCADILHKPAGLEELLSSIEAARKRNHFRECHLAQDSSSQLQNIISS